MKGRVETEGTGIKGKSKEGIYCQGKVRIVMFTTLPSRPTAPMNVSGQSKFLVTARDSNPGRLGSHPEPWNY